MSVQKFALLVAISVTSGSAWAITPGDVCSRLASWSSSGAKCVEVVSKHRYFDPEALLGCYQLASWSSETPDCMDAIGDKRYTSDGVKACIEFSSWAAGRTVDCFLKSGTPIQCLTNSEVRKSIRDATDALDNNDPNTARAILGGLNTKLGLCPLP